MIEIDAAIGGPYDALEKIIEANHIPDSSGFRRFVVAQMGLGNMQRVASALSISVGEANALKQVFVDAWGPPPNTMEPSDD